MSERLHLRSTATILTLAQFTADLVPCSPLPITPWVCQSPLYIDEDKYQGGSTNSCTDGSDTRQGAQRKSRKRSDMVERYAAVESKKEGGATIEDHKTPHRQPSHCSRPMHSPCLLCDARQALRTQRRNLFQAKERSDLVVGGRRSDAEVVSQCMSDATEAWPMQGHQKGDVSQSSAHVTKVCDRLWTTSNATWIGPGGKEAVVIARDTASVEADDDANSNGSACGFERESCRYWWPCALPSAEQSRRPGCVLPQNRARRKGRGSMAIVVD